MQHRGFSTSRRAHDRHEFARRDLNIHALQRRNFHFPGAVYLPQVFGLEYGLQRYPLSSFATTKPEYSMRLCRLCLAKERTAVIRTRALLRDLCGWQAMWDTAPPTARPILR